MLGLFVCPIMTFGGAIRAGQSLKRVREGKIEEQEQNNNASGEVMIQSGSWFCTLNIQTTVHLKDEQSQSSSGSSQTATEADHWVKIGGKDVNAR
jgi:hypothetical protein